MTVIGAAAKPPVKRGDEEHATKFDSRVSG